MKEIVYKHSAGGVIINDGKVLTITSQIRNSTGFPKGKIDEGESPEAAAIREVKEETGYDVEIIKKLDDYTFEFDWTDGKRHVKTVTYYAMQLANSEPPKQNLQSGEDFEVVWIPIAEATQQLTYDEAKEALAVALS